MENQKPYHIAIIDMGSNTARLVMIKAIPGYSYRVVDEIREVVRLRQGMTEEGLSEEAMNRAFSTLHLFKRFCDSTEVDLVLPTATSAVREAANGRQFVEEVESRTGLKLRILDGSKEAYFGSLGALNEVPIKKGYILDIGGGSAQLSEIHDTRFHQGQALPLGALALTERFISEDPVSDETYLKIQAEIDRQLDTLDWIQHKIKRKLIGLGGTIRNLAKIEAVRQKYPLNTLHGFSLSYESIEESIRLFKNLSLEERQKIPGLKGDRADIILPGAMVLLSFMRRLEVKSIAISTSGLREGIFFEQFWKHLPYPVIPDVRSYSVLNIARIYQYHKRHANHVRFLAGKMFDQLIPLHGYGSVERELLNSAALLHDLGTIIGYHGHHKHSQTLIEYNGLAGFYPREIAIIGLLARYHRKGIPETSNYTSLLQEGDNKLVTCLASILRLAEFLERGRNSAVDDIIITWNDEELRLTLIADVYPAVELWEAERNAVPLVALAFKKKIVLDSVAAPAEWANEDE